MLFMVIFALALVVACQPAAVCEFPKILIAGECCDDLNNDTVCDFAQQSENSSAAAPQLSAPSALSFEELQSGIYDAFYPEHRYTFELEEREDITGIENTYETYVAPIGGWPYSPTPALYILKIKASHNFQHTLDQSNDFVERLYDLNVKNQNIWAAEYIELMNLEDINWRGVWYNYTHSIEPVQLAGREGFIELHSTDYIKPHNNFFGGELVFKITVPCTPESLVEIRPLSEINLGWSDGVAQAEVFANTMREIEYKKKDMLTAAEKISRLCQGVIPETETPDGTMIRFLGPGGFDPQEVHVKIGEKVLFYNEKEDGRGMIILIQNQKNKKIQVIPVINIGQYGEIIIEESGMYTYWNDQFGGKGTLVVE